MDVLTSLSLLVSVAALLAFGWVVHRRNQDLLRSIDRSEAQLSGDDALTTLIDRVAALTSTLDDVVTTVNEFREWKGDIIVAVDEGIREVKRREERVKATVRRAQKELAEVGYEHPGLEAEATELQLIDGGGGEDPGVPPMYEDMADASQGPEPSSIPGVTAEQLRRARGF